MNIIVSGWPGVGQTTLSLLLAKTLGFSLLQGSNTFRFIWAGLNHENTGQDRIDAEVLQYTWGVLYEKYIAWKIMHSDNIVLESDITAFIIKDPEKVFSIFLKCDYPTRQQRLSTDGRIDDVNLLYKRDQELGEVYFKQFGADFLNESEIRKYHSIVIDNTHLNFEQELFVALQGFDASIHLEDKAKEVVLQYLGEGKQSLLASLEEEKLIYPLDQIFKDVTENFKTEFEKLPQDIKTVILNKINGKN